MNIHPSFLRRGGRALLLLAAIALPFVGCGDDPVAQPTPSFEAHGAVLTQGGTSVVTVDTANHVTGSITVEVGKTTDSLALKFLLKDGSPSLPTDGVYTLLAISDDPATASVALAGTWGVRVTGVRVGSANLILKLLKAGSTIYTSASIPITVTRPAAAFDAGDTLSYTYYDRDTLNQNDPSSKKVRKWFVVEGSLSIYGRTNVSKIYEVTYDAAGANELGRDTIYMEVAADGAVYQYNYLHVLLKRISGGESFITQIPDQWVKVGDVKSTGAATWSSITPDTIKLKSISLPGIPLPIDVVFTMVASHKGTRSVTVPAGAYNSVFHTDHSLRLKINLSGAIPVPVLNDSLNATFDIASNLGIVRQTLDGKNLVASALGQTIPQPVLGYEGELTVVARKP
jgi:hypothetical protein